MTPPFALLLAALQTLSAQTQAPVPHATLWWGDYNGDGLADAVVLRPGGPRLLENLGRGDFADATARVGLEALADARQAVWQDLEGDGDLDLLLVSPTAGLRLWRNQAGALADVTASAGLADRTGFVHASFLALDGDQRPDLWLAGVEGDVLLRQEESGAFAQVHLQLAPLDSGQGVAALVESAGPRSSAQPAEEVVRPAAADARPRAAERGAERGSEPAREAVVTGGAGLSGASPAASLPAFACVPGLKDQATSTCLNASSLPTLGALYPLGPELNIDLAGRVGMGTTTPTHRLTIQGQGSDDVLRLVGTQGAFLHGARLNLGDGDNVHLWEHVDDELEVLGRDGLDLTSTVGDVRVEAPIGNVEVQARLLEILTTFGAVMPTGKLGLGTTNPLWPVDVLASQAVVKLTSSTSANGSVLELRSQVASPAFVGAINFVNAAGQFNGQVAYSGADDLTLRAGGSERLRVASSGNVGIGTTSPSRKLYVAGGTISAVLGETTNPSGDGVHGLVNSTGTGAGWGVRGESRTIGGQGVHGAALAGSGQSHGVFGTTSSRDGAGVFGFNSADPTTGNPTVSGVYGEVDTARGQGVWGRNFETVQVAGTIPVGVLGTAASVGYALFAEGDIGATGTKFFLQPHPGDATKMLRFACLEGNEAGTYCRGSEVLVGGRARIPLPEDFRLASARDELTAQLTPRGPARLWVEALSPDELVVRGDVDVPFDWLVNGVRRGYEELETIRENSAFVPRVRGLPFLQDRSEEFRRLLVEAGITNEDGTPDEATAAALGWELLERDDPRAARWLSPDQRPQVEKGEAQASSSSAAAAPPPAPHPARRAPGRAAGSASQRD